MIQRVLFPVDFSSGSQALVPTVRRMIESWHAEVILMHVIETGDWPAQRQELSHLMARLRSIAEDGLHSRRVTLRLEQGDPAERILEHIRWKSVDLVVTSAAGSPHAHASPIGPVADEVLTKAPCSVWLDWGSARSRPQAGMYARRVACALGLNDSDEYVLSEATDISGNLEAGLTVIHVVCPSSDKPIALLRDQRIRDGVLERAKRRIEGLLRFVNPAAELAVEVGSPQAVVSRILQNDGMGLLITGNAREAILAARHECPVLRLGIPAASTVAATKPEPCYAMAARRIA